LAEVSRGHSRFKFDWTEGPNESSRGETFISMVKEMPTKREEKPKFQGGSSGRNLQVKPLKASSTTANQETTDPRPMQLIEAVVERSNVIAKSEAPGLKDGLNRRIRNRTSGGVGGRS